MDKAGSPTNAPGFQIDDSADVIKLLGQGKLSFVEAKELMLLFQTQIEIEELPKLLAALEKAENETD